MKLKRNETRGRSAKPREKHTVCWVGDDRGGNGGETGG